MSRKDGPPAPRTVQVDEVEELINHVPGVHSCKVVVNDWGAVEEIHVVATTERNPKQMSRDIQSSLQARFGMDVDHRKISIAQLVGLDPTLPPVRLKVMHVDVVSEVARGQLKVRITLGQDADPDARYIGEAQGTYGRLQIMRLTAEAALQAVNGLFEEDRPFSFEEALVTRVGGTEVAIVTVGYQVHRADEEILVGAAVVKHDVSDAVVRATLDAVNRRAGKLYRAKKRERTEEVAAAAQQAGFVPPPPGGEDGT